MCIRFMQYFIVQDIAVTLLLLTQLEHNSSLYLKISTSLAVTRKFNKTLENSWSNQSTSIKSLMEKWSSSLFHGRLHSYSVEEDFVSEKIKFWRRIILRWLLRLTAPYCFKISRADCIKLRFSFLFRVEQVSVKLITITLQLNSKFNADILDCIKRRDKYFSI